MSQEEQQDQGGEVEEEDEDEQGSNDNNNSTDSNKITEVSDARDNRTAKNLAEGCSTMRGMRLRQRADAVPSGQREVRNTVTAVLA